MRAFTQKCWGGFRKTAANQSEDEQVARQGETKNSVASLSPDFSRGQLAYGSLPQS
jgi:hypothetical protein